ncbi:glycerol dehyrdratase activator, partial [Klebsiella pneumoniae]
VITRRRRAGWALAWGRLSPSGGWRRCRRRSMPRGGSY